MRIILFAQWPTNIGNEIINRGARACLKKAFPEAWIFEVSLFPNYIATFRGFWVLVDLIGQKLGRMGSHLSLYAINRMETSPLKGKVVNISELMDPDLVVFTGVILDSFLACVWEVLYKLKKKGVPIVFFGASGGYRGLQDSKVMTWVESKLKKLKPEKLFLFSRDSETYERYADYFEFSYDGICPAFFIDEWYTPPKTQEEFVVAVFDRIPEPKINTVYKIIRAHHNVLESPYSGFVKNLGSLLLATKAGGLKRGNTLVSHVLEDYLFLYANAKEVHSDRIHACVAALAYGRPARLYISSPRVGLFDKVVNGDITKELVTVNRSRLEAEKEKLVSILREELRRTVDDSRK